MSTRARLDDELPAVRHGVARIDGEIQQRVLDLAGIDHDHRQLFGEPRLDLDGGAEAAPQQIDHARDERIEIGRLGVQGLPPPEGEQPLGELGAELGGLLGLLENLAILRLSRRRSSISRLPEMTVRRLLKSWATPPVSWPMASIFCAWRSSCSILTRAVRSRMKPVKMEAPPSFTSPTASSMGKIVPSLRCASTSRPMPMIRFSPVRRYRAR